MRYVEEQIPNSYYLEMGEGKYAGVQENGATTIKLVGESAGTFTLDMEEVQGNSTVKTTTFADIPVMENSIATVQTTGLTTIPTLKLDIDGDGTTDATVDSGTGISTDDLIGILKGTVKTLGLPQKKQQDLLKKIDKLEKALDKEYKSEKKQKRKTKEMFKDVLQKIKQLDKKNYKATKALLLVLKKEIEVLSKQKIANKWQVEKTDALRLFATLDILIEKVNINIPKK